MTPPCLTRAPLVGALLAVGLILTACPKQRPRHDSLLAPLVDARGRIVGNVEAHASDSGVQLTAKVYALPRASEFWLVTHAAGACTGHTFSDAGPPWTPVGASGPMRLGPLLPDDQGRAVVNAHDPAVTLSGVRNGLAGRAVVLVRASEEELPRACGVLAPPPESEVRVSGEQPQITDAFDL